MAQIVLGVGTSHGPLLNTPPEEWGQRATADRRNPALAYRGQDYTFEQLLDARGERFDEQSTPAERARRYAACRAAIDSLGAIVTGADLDALVVISSDHKEIFDDELLPQFAFYYGSTVQHEPYTQADLAAMAPGLAVAEVANVPQRSTTRTCDADLALHLIKQASAAGFDPAASAQLPAGRYRNHGIPHGWGFVYQQLLDGDGTIPLVPLFVNTFWEPNQPSAARCYQFGRALGEAIASYPRDLRVGIVASGGLSHFVVDEQVDRDFLEALVRRDREHLSGLPDALLRSGTSELRSWIVAAAAVEATPLAARVLDYQPCYRSEAGTGCAMGFVAWQPAAA